MQSIHSLKNFKKVKKTTTTTKMLKKSIQNNEMDVEALRETQTQGSLEKEIWVNKQELKKQYYQQNTRDER